MARLSPEPRLDTRRTGKTAVLLVNLGTPDAPTPEAVRPYLDEFLSDPRVVEIPRIVWWPILHLFVLTRRPQASAERYRQIWMKEGSPLRVYTERQALLLRGYLGERRRSEAIVIDYAMRYGRPGIPEKLQNLKAEGCERILILPLYPQYSSSTTATAFDAAFGALMRMRNQPEIRTVRDFHDDAGYVSALATTVRDSWARRGRADMLLMSFHGAPARTVALGDPYQSECQTTARLLAEGLGLAESEYRVTFQSRFGRAEWLKPYTADVLVELGNQKLGRLDVICPGFVSDCLETLEEIAIEGKGLYTQAGGGDFFYIPCLNDRHEWLTALTDLVERNLQNWVASSGAGDSENTPQRTPSRGAHA